MTDATIQDAPTQQQVEALVQRWVDGREAHRTRSERADARRLRAIVSDPDSTAFVAAFLDRTGRPEHQRTAADQLARVVADLPTGSFLSPLDAALLRAGRWIAPLLPAVVMPIAQRRLRHIVGHLIAPAEPAALRRHIAALVAPNRRLNVNLLGEAVLGNGEANRRFDALVDMLDQPDIDYVSVKLSAILGRVPQWDHDASVERLAERLGALLDRAASTTPRTFINVDMEEYKELDATLDAFMQALAAPSRLDHEAGIVIQAYLPEALPRLQQLAGWAQARHARGGAAIKVRLVKGANLAMERVEAERHGWVMPTVASKVHADANFKACIDWFAQQSNGDGLRLGIASHNLFDIAWGLLLAESRNVADRVEFEMLQGMAPAYARQIGDASTESLVTYTPAVASSEFDVALGYLFRRLEENAAPSNFMRDLDELQDPDVFAAHATAFAESMALRANLSFGPARTQDRSAPPAAAEAQAGLGEFRNEADTDPSLHRNREWMRRLVESPIQVDAPPAMGATELAAVIERLRFGADGWATRPPAERAAVIDRCADALSELRGELISTMVTEAHKTVGEADIEIAEAIDFARYYARQIAGLTSVEGARFAPFGLVAVCSPWNFPVAIACGGVFAALAAGNTVALKPSPSTRRCATLIAEACRRAEIPSDVFALTPVDDGPAGRTLVTEADAVILTGSTATADRFVEWKPDMRLFAETSGKNALIITPSADLDQAVADLVASAFGHSGQKCSAASLAILVGDVGRSERFRRQLIDAVTSLAVGPATDLTTDVAPLIGPPNERLRTALEATPARDWLVTPVEHPSEANLWSPGVIDSVEPDSWFHLTECFGPVLGLMRAETLDDAIELANRSPFGLTGGIHTLDPDEAATWLERVEVGNAYINRSITGAIVQRQPFGGWKRSAVGPGAKAGGPNYVAQLGHWAPLPPTNASGASLADDDFEHERTWHFATSPDPSGLETESNVFRYVPLEAVLLRIQPDATATELALARKAASTCNVRIVESAADEPIEDLIARLPALLEGGVERVRIVGSASPSERGFLRAGAHRLGLPCIDDPVLAAGRIELTRWCKEQSVSQTTHRFGSTLGQRRAHRDTHQHW